MGLRGDGSGERNTNAVPIKTGRRRVRSHPSQKRDGWGTVLYYFSSGSIRNANAWQPVVKVQNAEKHPSGAKQAAEKLSCCQVLCQGTTSVVPIEAKMNFRL